MFNIYKSAGNLHDRHQFDIVKFFQCFLSLEEGKTCKLCHSHRPTEWYNVRYDREWTRWSLTPMNHYRCTASNPLSRKFNVCRVGLVSNVDVWEFGSILAKESSPSPARSDPTTLDFLNRTGPGVLRTTVQRSDNGRRDGLRCVISSCGSVARTTKLTDTPTTKMFALLGKPERRAPSTRSNHDGFIKKRSKRHHVHRAITRRRSRTFRFPETRKRVVVVRHGRASRFAR